MPLYNDQLALYMTSLLDLNYFYNLYLMKSDLDYTIKPTSKYNYYYFINK